VVTAFDRLPEDAELGTRVVRKPFAIDVLERELAAVCHDGGLRRQS
jgi:hypothetical protein